MDNTPSVGMHTTRGARKRGQDLSAYHDLVASMPVVSHTRVNRVPDGHAGTYGTDYKDYRARRRHQKNAPAYAKVVEERDYCQSDGNASDVEHQIGDL